jgi:hypothetical protein
VLRADLDALRILAGGPQKRVLRVADALDFPRKIKVRAADPAELVMDVAQYPRIVIARRRCIRFCRRGHHPRTGEGSRQQLASSCVHGSATRQKGITTIPHA